MAKWLAAGLLVLALAGCSDKLESGYTPRRLDMSLAQRRAMYSDPFTPESKAAEGERAAEMKERRQNAEGY